MFNTLMAPSSDILFQAAPFETVVPTTTGTPPEPSTISTSRDTAKDNSTPTPTPKVSFESFAETIRADLPAKSILEKVLVERVILAAWRLHVASERDVERISLLDRVNPVTPEILRSECSLETAFSLLETARRLSRPRWGVASEAELASRPKTRDIEENDSTDAFPHLSNEWPILHADSNPRDSFREVISEPAEEETIEEELVDEPAPTRWQDRLVFDFNVSETSPVVKGTWITVNQVVSMIVDGCRWSDILRDHPELTEEDIRTCLAYTIEQDNFGEV